MTRNSPPAKNRDPDPPSVAPDSTPNPAPGATTAGSGLMYRLRNYFLAGILITAPIGITLYVAWSFISFVDSRVTPLIPPRYNPSTYLPFDIPGFGLIVAIVSLILIGALTANFAGRLLLRTSEMILARMPVIRGIYSAVKQLVETVLGSKAQAFREVVLLEYPRPGIWSLGFITGITEGEVQELTEDQVLNVFVPTTPNPTSGFLLFVPRRDLVMLAMTVEEGIKMVVSGGIVTPPDRRPPELRARTRGRVVSHETGSAE